MVSQQVTYALPTQLYAKADAKFEAKAGAKFEGTLHRITN